MAQHEVNGLGETCLKCGGIGHYARECPSKGKGKGKSAIANKGKGKGDEKGSKGKGKGKAELDKGKGKGKAAPQYGNCWTCGGPHFSRDCPKGVASSGAIRSLSSIREVRMKEDEEQIDDHTTKEKTRCEQHNEVSEDHNTKEKAKEKRKDRERNHCKCNLKMRQGKKFCAGYNYQPRADMWHKFESRNTFKVLEVEDDDEACDDIVSRCETTTKEQTPSVVKHRWNKNRSHSRKSINTLVEIIPPGVNAMEELQEWEEIEMAVDSGATETVVGEDMIKGVETKPGEGTRRGVQYEVASGELIPNLGEKNFVAYGEQGEARTIKAQVCDVNKALMSVSRMVQAGNKVVFSKSGSYVEDESTQERIPLREQGGMYMLKLWVKNQSFQRQAEEAW